jgi:hypothetical protein
LNTICYPGLIKVILLNATDNTGKSENNTIKFFYQPYIFVSTRTLGLIHRKTKDVAATGVFYNNNVSIVTDNSDLSKFSIIGLEWYDYPFMFTRYT